MRISDWSSDVCSSDLIFRLMRATGAMQQRPEYAEYAALATEAALPGEVVSLIKAGKPASPRGNPGTWVTPDDYPRSEEHTSELQSLMRISYAVFCLKKKNKKNKVLHKVKTINTKIISSINYRNQ